MIKNKSLLLVRAMLVGLLLVACNGGAGPSGTSPLGEENLEVNELSVLEDTVAEPIFINNCGNPASAEQVSEHSQTITVEVGAGLEVGNGVVKGSVEGKYSSTKSVKKSQKVVAAPYTNMKFILLWTERVSEGTVTASGQSDQATYRVSVPIAVEQVSAENLGCSTDILDLPTATSAAIPTLVNTASASPSPELEADRMDTILVANLLEGKAPLVVNFDARASSVHFTDGSVSECGNSQFCSFTFTIIPDGRSADTIHKIEGRLSYKFSRKGEYIVAVYVCRGDACDEDSVMITIR